MLLSVCFERPLAIVRAERQSASDGKPFLQSLAVHGINEKNSPVIQRKLEVARHNIDLKKNVLDDKSQEEAKARKDLQTKSDDPKKLSEQQAMAAIAVEKAAKDLNEARERYAAMCQPIPQPENEMQMTITALELQHQGFKIIGL